MGAHEVNCIPGPPRRRPDRQRIHHDLRAVLRHGARGARSPLVMPWV